MNRSTQGSVYVGYTFLVTRQDAIDFVANVCMIHLYACMIKANNVTNENFLDTNKKMG